MKIKVGLYPEWIYVFLFIFFLGYIGMATTMNYQLRHPFPYALSASDAFGEVAYTEGIIELGSYKVLPSYIRSGFDDTLGFHMPIYNHMVALFSLSSGLPVWDSLLIVGFLFSLVAVLVMFIIIRSFNKHVALIALALSVFLYVRYFSIVYTWGMWDLVMATALLLASIWVLNRFELPYSTILFAILASGVALTHISEAIFLFMFTLVFFTIKFIRKEWGIPQIKKLAISGILALFLSFYYLIIFKKGYAAGGVNNSIRYHAPQWYDVVFSQFGLVLWVILAGIIISVIFLLNKKSNIAIIAGLFMLLMGFTNFIASFSSRAFQTRYLWPIYLSIFVGITLYFLLKIFIKNWKIVYSIAISLILTASITYAFYEKTSNQGLMSQPHWEHVSWVRQNVPENSRLLYFYGDPYDQEAVLWNLKRISYRVDIDDFVDAINEKKIKRYYLSGIAAADDARLLYRKSAFSFGYHADERNTSYYFGEQDICKFDYFVFDKVGRQQVLVQYNLLIANELFESGLVEVAFDNGIVLILKNNKLGGDCIEEREF